MPVYCYTSDDGEVREKVYRMGDQPREFAEEGKIFRRDYHAEHAGFRDTPGAWPMYSEAAGVHPKQIGEAQAKLAERGVKAEFTPDGRVKLESRGHRREVLRAFGLRDNSGGYSD